MLKYAYASATSKYIQNNEVSKIRFKYILPFIILLTISVYTVSANSVLLNSEVKLTHLHDYVTVNITCNPNGRYVRGWELKIRFDPQVLSVNSISEGNFFEGFDTFHVLGTIDNSGGTVIDVYSLIVGKGNISSAGHLININFTAKKVGTSTISLYDVGICNETLYAPLSITNGSITVLRLEGEEPDNDTTPPVNDTIPSNDLPPISKPSKHDNTFNTFVLIFLSVLAIYIVFVILTRRK